MALSGFNFGRGHRPPKNSRWANELVKIEKCPKHFNLARGAKDAMGRINQCSCGYHVSQ